jgi:hypothetical protein
MAGNVEADTFELDFVGVQDVYAIRRATGEGTFEGAACQYDSLNEIC